MILNHKAVWISVFVTLSLGSAADAAGLRTRIFIVDSYNPEYLWSQDTAAGVGKALVDFQFLDNTRQVDELNTRFSVEGSKSVIKKAWMNTKQKSSKIEIGDTTARIVNEIKIFNPDIIFLGDDNAANYIGNHFIDREIPVVFWGINGIPLKYGLVDSIEHPGHNVSGIYQVGYTKECLEYLVQLVPDVKTVAVLSEDSETSRAKVKSLQAQAASGGLSVKIIDVGITNSFSKWKEFAQRFAQQADALVVFNHNTLKDDKGLPVDQMAAGAWYLNNIKKPECSDAKQFALEGILLVVDDSGFKQGYEAVHYADKILRSNKPPSELAVKAPERGAVIANRRRAAQLGISLDTANFVEEIVDESIALENK
ncbi:MAG: hypothetical protein IT395_06250 [Candidatus Omnitrophica bacterium]|nr:hypothetical protein [Candidatus Omnitrophota bacterium]